MTTELTLDICTPEGKTWLAEVVGTGGKYGIERVFRYPARKVTSRSGLTGTAYFLVEDGIYESNEGRHRLGRRFWIVGNGEVREVDRAEAVATFEGRPV